MLTLFEALLTKNAVDNLKFVSRKRVVIWLNGCPFHKCGTSAYQSTKYERIRILSCVRDFFGFYRHLLLIRAILPRENAEKCTFLSGRFPSVYQNDPTIPFLLVPVFSQFLE